MTIDNADHGSARVYSEKDEEGNEENLAVKIEDAKDTLDAGTTIELDLPALPGYLVANYRAWVDERGNYTFDVHYKGERARRLPLYGSRKWADFLYHLTPILKSSDWKLIE